jgi:peptide-methionine (S)-S-oxide reductase
MEPHPEREIATLGAGCFWCIEAVLLQVDGVLAVRPGYMGGHVEQPTYEQVCTGRTGHAEVVQVEFDPARLPYSALLAWFWRLHDPTTKDRQGNDVGPQYRSVIFAHSEEQRVAAEASRRAAQADFRAPIVTEIVPAQAFWAAEEIHLDYYRQNPRQGYCRYVIAPKLEKLGLAT